MSSIAFTTIDDDYRAFLRARLPALAACNIPWYRKTPWTKHDTLRYCLRSTPIDESGLFMEFGVFKGTTIRRMGKSFPKRAVYGFDSFEGFPDDGRKDWKHDFSLGGNLPEVPNNVQLIKGFFDATLPPFVAAHKGEHIAFLHIDCDIYSSTVTIFKECEAMIKPGCVIIFDELLHYKGFLANEMRAFYEFIERTGLDFEWVAIRGKVMEIDVFLADGEQDPFRWKTMKDWRAEGYEQEVALRII